MSLHFVTGHFLFFPFLYVRYIHHLLGDIIIIIIIIIYLLPPVTPLPSPLPLSIKPTAIPTAQSSSVKMQHFPYFLSNTGSVSLYNTHTHISTFYLPLHISPLWTHSSLSYPIILFIFKPPIHSTSPQFSFSWCFMMKIILLSGNHFSFHIFKPDIFPPLSKATV